MDYSTKKEHLNHDVVREQSTSPTMRYVQKKTNGTVKSCLVFSIKPRTAEGVKRLRIKGVLEG